MCLPNLFFFKIVLTILSALHFYINLRITLPIFSKDGSITFDRSYAESVNQFVGFLTVLSLPIH